uniref:Uncharacterized protein n=1 Tax=Nelumbo nucifera TaxID=4432 RepID=A0A822ZNH0_NELNU|nr:TPA_asm: hypothetical protein HUJ06_001568 [Nelumbo nucifera]
MAGGLIPYVYSAIKRPRTRLKYEFITLGRVQTLPAYNYGEFPTSGHYYLGPPPEKMAGYHEHHGHRPYRSMEEREHPEKEKMLEAEVGQYVLFKDDTYPCRISTESNEKEDRLRVKLGAIT